MKAGSRISFYRYIEEEGSLEEKFFIPVTVSSQMLRADLGELTYVNQSDMCYFLYGNSIYSVDLTSGRMRGSDKSCAEGHVRQER